MKVLVVAGEAVSAESLRGALGDDVEPQQAEVMVVAPALQESGFKFWLSDVDEAIERAESVRSQTVSALCDEGIAPRSETGESDPGKAIEDALQTFPADRILIFTEPGAPRYREDVSPEEIEERYGIPVTVVGGG
jgi:hypothetical protein